jgi:O-antigen/teichoic acid export membrane protein
MTSIAIKQRAFRSAAWTIMGYGIQQVVRFGSNLILTKLLVPEFFGLMSFVNTVRIGIELFSDLGIPHSIVNSKRGDDPQFLNTAWTLQVMRGWLLWLISLIITYPIARYYGDDRLLLLIPLIGLSSVFDGFSSTAIHTTHRHLDLGRYTRFEVAVNCGTIGLTLLFAWVSPTIWALAFAGISAALVRMVGSYWLIPGTVNWFAWDRDAVKELFSFGRWMFVATALMFLAEQADRLILAKLFSFQLLGIYTIAYTLANMPKEVIKHLSHRVIFPTISQQRELSRQALRAKIIKQRQPLLLGIAAGLAALVSIGDLVITALYDQRYTQATWMMPILCCGIWFSVLFYTTSPALLSIGKPLYAAQSNLARLLVITLGLPLGHAQFGLVGAITVIAFSDFPLYLVNLYGLYREKLFCLRQDLQMTLFFMATLALFLAIRQAIGFGLPLQTIAFTG